MIDLHVDTFIWARIFGYDLTKRHGRGPFNGKFLGQVDIPRIREANVGGAIWSITTNPLPTRARRRRAFAENLENLKSIFASVPKEAKVVRNASDFQDAREHGLHAALIGIQGGNSLDDDIAALDLIGDDVIRVTLVHLSTSSLGITSSPMNAGKKGGLTSFGKEYVKRLNEKRVFVDLAHINRQGFFDAVEAHDRSQPLIVTHTGIAGAHAHWRNLDDEQIKAIAETGGTIGIMYQSSFLGDPFWGGKSETILKHMEHVIRVAGDDFVSLGSDWDGLIVPPLDMPTCLELPILVQHMLKRGWKEERIRKILGGNFLRALKLLRP